MVRFNAEDGVAIVGDYKAPKKGRPVLVLLHGLGAGRGEWAPWISSLTARGYGSLAIDARGHGDSGGPRYKEFRGAGDWMRVEWDLAAAIRYLEKSGIRSDRVILAGASIGANLSLRAAADGPRLLGVVLLSPGMAYQGVDILEAYRKVKVPVFLAAAPDDPYAMQTCMALNPSAPNAAEGHGVNMLKGEDNAAFVRELFDWLEGLKPASASSLSIPAGPSKK